MHAHFDCFAGISGDMTLGALNDLGVPLDWLEHQLRLVPLTGFTINAGPTKRHGISGQQVQVMVTDDESHRNWSTIDSLIDESPLSPKVKKLGRSIFKRLAIAEGAIHQIDPEQVHFHEVGGVDAMVDIIGTALGMDYLGITSFSASPIALGRGMVSSRHGIIPIPSPATMALLKNIPVYGTEISHELTTPTGAAIISELTRDFSHLPALHIKKVGYGAGQRDHNALPNMLRVILGNRRASDVDSSNSYLSIESVMMVEATIDDMNPEVYGYLMEQLFVDGALDVIFLPVQMKKNRPGTMVQVLCYPKDRELISARVLTETTTLGIRFYPMQREILQRQVVECETTYGIIKVKKVIDLDGGVRMTPEFESCRLIALKHGQSIRKIYDTLLAELQQMH